MSKPSIIACLLATIVLHVGVHQHYRIENQKSIISLLETRAKINDEEVTELQYVIRNKDFDDTKSSLARIDGILSVIKDDDEKKEYNDIWHNGYYRGLAQQRPEESGTAITEK